MKRSLTSFVFANVRMFLFLGVVALVAALGVLPYYMTARAQIKTGSGLFTRTVSHDPELPNYDIREAMNTSKDEAMTEFFASARSSVGRDASEIADIRDGFVRGESKLRARVPDLKIDYSTDMRHPSVVSPDVYKAKINRLTSPSGGNRVQILKSFLKDNNELIGMPDQEIDGLKVKVDATNPNGYLSFVYLTQEINGIPVYRSELRAGFTKTNEIIRVLNDMTPGIDYGSASSDFGDPLAAVNRAYLYINKDPGAESLVRNDKTSTDLKTVYGQGDWATTAEKMYFPTEVGVVRPAWRVLIWLPVNAFYVIVDAETGTMLSRENITADQTQSATYNVYTNPVAYVNSADSPAPLSPYPGNDPGTATQGTFLPRNNVTRIGNEAPNPGQNNLGWITDGANITDGNNLEGGIDRDGTNGVDAPQTGSPNRTFDAPTWNPPPGAPAPGDDPLLPQAQRGAVIQMFYSMNLYHDALYDLGFTEQFENFQNDNFGRGGVAADRISAEGQDSSGTNNANFATPADGGRGRMQMFLWTGPTPDYDGTTDMDVIFHEVTHGTSTRLHNGLGNQGGMMGEGWSDWYAHTMLSEPGDPTNGVHSLGGYALFEIIGLPTFHSNYYYGIRKWPKAVKSLTGGPARPGCGNAPCPHNPLSFRHINAGCFTELGSSTVANISAFPMTPAQAIIVSTTCSQVHNAGEIWSSALWEVRALMINRLGWAAGTRRVLQVVTDGMKLAPANPMMLQERDAIIAAASALPIAPEASADVADVREGFRIRGMGFFASTQSATAVTEDFSGPNVTVVDPFSVSDSSGDNDGFPESGEPVLLSVAIRNQTGSTVNNVQGSVTGGGTVNYGNIPDGQTVTMQIPYTVPANVPCGSLHQVQLIASSAIGAQAPVTREFRVGVPVGGAPVVASNPASLTLPDGTGANPAPASVYPSNVTVAGANGFTNAKLTVGLNGYTQTFPGDNDFLLVGPAGQKFTMQSDQGGGNDIVNVSYSMNDAAAAALPATLTAGTFRPTADASADIFPAPAPAAPYQLPAPGGAATFASTFGTSGAGMDGTWSLYVVDDAGGDTGTISGGWSLTVESNDFACSFGGASADLSITKTDGVVTVNPGQAITYTIVARNNSTTTAVTGATVTDTFPSPALGAVTWTCVGAGGGTCTAGGAGNINDTVNLPAGATVTYTANATVAANATFAFSNTATVTPPQGTTDPAQGNNSARDTDVVCTPAQQTFVGAGVGPIPDRTTAGCGAPAGAPLNITFNSTATGTITNVEVDMTATHSWVGDVDVQLIAPDGTTHNVFSDTGSTTTTGCGADDDLAGLYGFGDSFAGNWWTEATTVSPMAPGNYRTSTVGDVVGGGTVTSMTPVFAAVNPAGTWTLRVTDEGNGDTGSVSAANLRITTSGGGCPTTAAGVTVSGRVLTPDGAGLRNAVVTITDSTGMTKTARTSSFGYYTFEGIEVGGTYVVSVGSKRYTFTPRTITVNDAVSDLDFIGNGSE